MIKFLFAVAVIISLASTAYAITCNVCSTATKADCGDPFKAGKTYATDCNTLENPLKLFSSIIPDVKVEQASGCLKLKFESAGEVYTNRVCYWGDAANSAESCKQSGKLMQGAVKQLTCDVCTKDLCNSSTSTGVFAATVMFLVVLVRMIS